MEERSLMRSLLSLVLEDDVFIPSWSTSATMYYDVLAARVQASDAELVEAVERVVAMVRTKYRTHLEHECRVFEVPVTKEMEHDRLDEDCCACLGPLKSHKRVVRMRGTDSNTCGHFIHAACLAKIPPAADGDVTCPVCRASLGPRPLFTGWIDVEREVPKF